MFGIGLLVLVGTIGALAWSRMANTDTGPRLASICQQADAGDH